MPRRDPPGRILWLVSLLAGALLLACGLCDTAAAQPAPSRAVGCNSQDECQRLQDMTRDAVAGSSGQLLRTQSRRIAERVDERTDVDEQRADAGRRRGLSAGDPESALSVFVDTSGAFLRSARITDDGVGAGFDGTSTTALFGLDYLMDGRLLLGFVAGYQRSDLSLATVSGTRGSDGAVFGPYLGYILSPTLTADVSFQYTSISTDLVRRPPGPAVARASFGSDRYAGAANLTARTEAGGLNLTGVGGYTYTQEERGTFTDSSGLIIAGRTGAYGAVRLGGELGYPLQGGLEPFATATFEYQTTRPEVNSNRELLVLGGGLRYAVTDALDAGLLVTTQQVKEGEDVVTIAANLRLRL